MIYVCNQYQCIIPVRIYVSSGLFTNIKEDAPSEASSFMLVAKND